MRAVQISKTGGPDVMELVELPVPEPGPGQVRIDVEASGVNFIDTYHRSGVYPIDLPMVLGKEVAGTVSAVGDGVNTLTVGDRVMTPWGDGGYADECLATASFVFKIPDSFDAETAAAAALQGLTAHYLATASYQLKPGDRCLIHAGAGGVGGILIQIAKKIGAEVFTTVGSTAKVEMARQAGADHVIEYSRENFAEAVRAITGPDDGLEVVYDGVGKSTFDDGLGLLAPRGTFVLFGGASGQVPPFDLQRLNAGGSLFITRPSLGHFIQPGEGQRRADELLEWITSGNVKIRIGARFALEDAAAAHKALEGRQTVGKVLLIP
ncbi:MAG: quinone oxidoreductase [bacterium]|nr:quinone oxidoreductase [bacterium]